MTELVVLLVDDEQLKAQLIGSALSKVDRFIKFEHVSNAAAAREFLKYKPVDLVLVDINLPAMVDGAPLSNGGFQFMDMLQLEGGRMLSPEFVVLTSRDELFLESSVEAGRRGLPILAVSASTEDWRDFLMGVCERLCKRYEGRSQTAVDICIITAMRARELETVLKVLQPTKPWRSLRAEDDHTGYHHGDFVVGDRTVRIVAASAMQKGLSAASALTAKMATRMNPKLIVMLGICAGVSDKTRIGDVIVGNPTWDWGSGKHTQASDRSVVFRTGALQAIAAPALVEIAADVAEDVNTKRHMRAGWDKGFPEGELSIRIGPMASGASVLAHADVVRSIQDQNRDLLAVEMEAYGVMAAAAACDVSALAIKSVCDFADENKDDGWQDYAAYTSAAYFLELLPRLAAWLEQ